MVCHDPNCGNMYLYCSNVCEVASGLLTPRGRHNWTEIQEEDDQSISNVQAIDP